MAQAGSNPDKALKKEIGQLKQMIGDQAMVIDVFKKNLKRRNR